MTDALDIIVCGLTISSSWGNGHATTYRGLVRELAAQGHRVTFLERNVPWYSAHRDEPAPEGCSLHLYATLDDLRDRFGAAVRDADAVIVGSYVPQGVAVGRWVTQQARGVTAFYDIDTPVTLAKLVRGDHEYLEPALIGAYDVYLSFTGGPTLRRLERQWGAKRARPLYCSVDPGRYRPNGEAPVWDLGYLGTWSEDRQPKVDALLIDVARRRPERRFAVGGPSYPDVGSWPSNLDYYPHVQPADHASFYCRQRATLNVTRADMVRAGYSPSVRLFEAAACGVPILSDAWEGIEEVLTPGREVVLVRSADDVAAALDRDLSGVGEAGRRRVLAHHTSAHRAAELVEHLRVTLDAVGPAVSTPAQVEP
jgi:spore maturation protein CgeB